MPTLMLLLALLLLLPRQLQADGDVFGADSNRLGSLHDAVERAAASGSRATVRLGPGRHVLTHPLLLDQRHSGVHFVGGGSASISGAIEIGGPSAPKNGSKTVAGWSVVGPAKCLGCSEIWRATIPRGVDSRQMYINGRRANRTWIGFPPEANKAKWGTTITAPGTRLQSWRHNVSSIEVVYRGASSAGSQWTESRCPVAAITNGEALAGRLTPGIATQVYDCVADYCAGQVCPDCTSMPDHNCMPPGEGTVNKTGPVSMGAVCPKELPTCRNYLADHHWGTCFPTIHYASCFADYCAKAACPARGAGGGLVSKNFSHDNQSAVCPKQLPFCDGNVSAGHGGTCKAAPPDGSGSTIVHVEPQCARTGNAKSQPLSIPAYIENVFELLGSLEGQPGQFFLDSHAGFVYYVPQPGETPQNTVGHLPLVSQLIVASGVEDAVYEGITFEHSSWMAPSSKTGFVENQAGQYNICDYNCTPGSSDGGGAKCNTNCTRDHNIPGALQFLGAKDCAFNNCTFQHIGSVGLSFTGGSHRNHVSRCKFHDISASAVYIGTLEVSASSNLNNISQQDINNTVSDSVITHVAREFRGSPGVFIGISHGTELIHNEISFLPYSAVSVGWGWASYPHSFGGVNNISGNHIHSHMQLLGDGGAIYSLGAQGNMPFEMPWKFQNISTILPPSVQNHNWIHDSGDSETAALDHGGIGEGCHCPGGIYTDEGSTNWKISENVVQRTLYWLKGCGCAWIGPNWYWNNWYSASGTAINNNATRCPLVGDVEVMSNATEWPAEAAAVMRSAGPRAKLDDTLVPGAHDGFDRS